MEQFNEWKTRVLLLGGLIGAVSGLVAAYLIVKQAEEQEEIPQLGAGEGVRIGMSVMGLIRSIGSMGKLGK
ncbi:MAG: hypothetical protein PVF49_07135 [Anaerolineales bacterium]|jgi:hypothetical protein